MMEVAGCCNVDVDVMFKRRRRIEKRRKYLCFLVALGVCSCCCEQAVAALVYVKGT